MGLTNYKGFISDWFNKIHIMIIAATIYQAVTTQSLWILQNAYFHYLESPMGIVHRRSSEQG